MKCAGYRARKSDRHAGHETCLDLLLIGTEATKLSSPHIYCAPFSMDALSRRIHEMCGLELGSLVGLAIPR
jgi:hypothetical protein